MPEWLSLEKSTEQSERLEAERATPVLSSAWQASVAGEDLPGEDEEIFEDARAFFPNMHEASAVPAPWLAREAFALPDRDIWYEASETPPSNVVQQLLCHLLTRALLLTCEQLLGRPAELQGLWEQVQALYRDRLLSPVDKAKRLAQTIHRFAYLIPERWAGAIAQITQGIELLEDIQRSVPDALASDAGIAAHLLDPAR